MARARNIKPGFFTNDVLAEASPLARILFAGLWCFADREGRLQDRPKKIKAEILPYDQCDADELLKSLESLGFILRYEVEGTRFIQVLNFNKHQNPHVKEQESDIPAPCKSGACTVQEQCKPDETPEVAGLIPSSLIPDSLNHIPDPIEKHSPEKSGAIATKKKTISPLETLLSLGVEEQAAKDWLTVRKAKRAPFTETALNELKLEAGKAGIAIGQAVVICVKRNWQGFNATWNWNDDQNARASPVQSIHDKRANTIAELTGANRNERTNERDITGEAFRVA